MKLLKKSRKAQRKSEEKRKFSPPKLLLIVVLLGVVVLVGAGRAGFIDLPIPFLQADQGEKGSVEETADAPGDPAVSQPPDPQYPPPDPSDWRLMLVDNNDDVPRSFRVNLARVQGGYLVDERIAPELEQMLTDAKGDGVSLVICSAYRNVYRQRELFDEQIREYTDSGCGKEDALFKTMNLIARPGYSEHHIGLAVDIVTSSYRKLDDGFADTAAYRWMQDNAYKYGFILRYPAGKEDVTHISFEPWHYRYVGAENAKRIREQGLCLEEYLGVANTGSTQQSPQGEDGQSQIPPSDQGALMAAG